VENVTLNTNTALFWSILSLFGSCVFIISWGFAVFWKGEASRNEEISSDEFISIKGSVYYSFLVQPYYGLF
jgi:hypothetical protein